MSALFDFKVRTCFHSPRTSRPAKPAAAHTRGEVFICVFRSVCLPQIPTRRSVSFLRPRGGLRVMCPYLLVPVGTPLPTATPPTDRLPLTRLPLPPPTPNPVLPRHPAAVHLHLHVRQDESPAVDGFAQGRFARFVLESREGRRATVPMGRDVLRGDGRAHVLDRRRQVGGWDSKETHR